MSTLKDFNRAEHASVDNVAELILELARHHGTEHRDAHLDEMMATVVDGYWTDPIRTVVHRILVDHYPCNMGLARSN